MNEKIKEIEERWEYSAINDSVPPDKLKILSPFADIQNLLSEVKRLQRELEEQKALIPWIGELAQAKVKIERLQGEIEELMQGLDLEKLSNKGAIILIERERTSLKRLREGIEKHKKTMSHLFCGFKIDKINLELYKLLEEK